MPHPIAIPLPMPLQPEFESLVSEARDSLCSGLGTLMDSLYLYGSVSRGNARPGQSDLDLTVVLTRPPSREESNALEYIRLDLQARHPEVSKVDFDLGVREDVLKPANLYSWGYWIKHECHASTARIFNDRLRRFVVWMQQIQPAVSVRPTPSSDPSRR